MLTRTGHNERVELGLERLPRARVLNGDLESQRKCLPIVALVEQEHSAVHAAILQVVRVVAQTNRLNPLDNPLVGPYNQI